MSSYLNNFVGYFLNFFKKDKGTNERDATACFTPPRRCNSVIEDSRIKEDHRVREDLAIHSGKQKSVWTSAFGKVNPHRSHFVPDSRCSNESLLNPATLRKFLNQNEADTKQFNEKGDGINPPKKCCIYHDAAVGFSKEFPHFAPPTIRKLRPPEQPSYGLRRSASLESCLLTEDRKRLTSRQMLQKRHNLNPIDKAGGICLAADPGKDYAPFKEILDWTPSRHSESSHASNMFVEDHRSKLSKIPVYRKKCRPARVSRNPPKFERAVPKEPDCTCYREILARPMQRGWRVEGHAFYCPKSVVAYRSYLNTKLENLFRVISKKKYCGNIIDAASHSRWMRLAGVGVDEDANCFKKYAKGRVALPVGEYKSALEKLCLEANLDYWELARKMTDIEIGSGADSNSTNSTILERKQVVNKRNVCNGL